LFIRTFSLFVEPFFFVRRRMLEKLEVKESIYIYCFTFTHQLLTRHAMLACHIGPRMKLSSNRKFEDETGQFHSWGTNLSPRQKFEGSNWLFCPKKNKKTNKHIAASFLKWSSTCWTSESLLKQSLTISSGFEKVTSEIRSRDTGDGSASGYCLSCVLCDMLLPS